MDAAVALALVLGTAACFPAAAEPLARPAPDHATSLDRLSNVLWIEADRPIAGQPTRLHDAQRTWLRVVATSLLPAGWHLETAVGAGEARTAPVLFGERLRGPPSSID